MARSPYGNYAYAILTADALRTPDKVALTYCGERSFTYDRARTGPSTGGRTRCSRPGSRRGTRVAALLNETLHVAEVYLAQAKLGAVTAALNPYWPVETLRAVVEHSGVHRVRLRLDRRAGRRGDPPVAARRHHLDQGRRPGRDASTSTR